MYKMDIGFYKDKRLGGTDVVMYDKVALCRRSLFAAELIKKSISVGIPGVEDMEIVARCCDIADTAFNEFGARGWLLELPDEPIKSSEV